MDNDTNTTTDADNDLPRPRVLMVDDTPQNLVALEVVLEDLDCELDSVTSGDAALARLLKHDYALVLLDVQMPGMDGFEVAELMRSHQRTQTIPIIFVTALSKETRFVQQGYRCGAVDYLFKPIEPMLLQSKVNFFLGLDRQKKRLEAKLAQARRSEAQTNALNGEQ